MTLTWVRGLVAIALAALAVFGSGCAGPGIELEPWRAGQIDSASLAEHDLGAPSSELPRLAELRGQRELAQARQLALRLVALSPEDPDVLMAASRAESDAVFLFAEDDKHSRNHAAASALDYALAGSKRVVSVAADRAQLAWALGTSTHLQPMFERADHARRTLAAAESALELDPEEPTALATLALVHLRLETLPWIASVMAWDAPESSLAAAERFARRACARAPSRENRQILAKVMLAREKPAEARAQLDEALAAAPAHPRDAVLEAALRKLRESLD